MYEVIRNIFFTSFSLLRVVKNSRFFAKFPITPVVDETCFVFGNGPSLNIDLEKFNNKNLFGVVWCVNQFGISHLYKKIQPKHYVFADPSYWEVNESFEIIEMREHLFRSIIKNTNWNITIYAPYNAKKYFDGVFCYVPYVALVYYNIVPVIGAKKVVDFLYRSGLGMPLVQNVLVAALFLAIRRGYKRIYLLGADHSWHETLELDDINRVCFRDRHFYNSEVGLVPFTMGGIEQVTFTMPELFIAFAKMFEGYWKVKEYSESVGAEIYNASSVTYIDAFKRINFKDLLDHHLKCK